MNSDQQVICLNSEIRSELFYLMRKVLKEAIDNHANPDEFPEKSLLPNRNVDATCPLCGGTIDKIKVSGRSACYCKKHQSL